MFPPDGRLPFPTYLLPPFNFPFRRRQPATTSTPTSSTSPPSLSSSPTSSTNTSPSSSPPTTAHFLPQETLDSTLQTTPEKPKPEKGAARLHRAQPNTLKCVTCSSDIAFASQIVSKGFTGRHGRAFLVSLPPVEISLSGRKLENTRTGMLPNTKIGRSVNRELLTGQHVVADVSCTICSAVLGWKYLDARETAQKYKIGKYILEMKRVVLAVGWEDVPQEAGEGVGVGQLGGVEKEGDVVRDDVVVFDSEDEDECEDLFAGTWDPEVVAKRRGKRTWTRKQARGDV